MADVTRTARPGGYADAGAAIALTAATNADQECADYRFGSDLLVAVNTGAASHQVTVYSAADRMGRSNDLGPETIAAGAVRIYGPFPAAGWRQANGKLKLKGNNAEVKFGVIAGS